ncbi:MAG: protease modulator HflC [SAR202 cluster bacterium]|nr:protease modulator HflC [SAR202 cluster bacterium]|tara:strand:+ start:8026 stop:8916 length:891 start_codon:yes stop_codon:yes gene_type:complete
MRGLLIGIVILLGIGVFVGTQAVYIVDETQQALVLQFGAPVGDPKTSAGLQFKAPFVQRVLFFEKRILSSDAPPQEYLTTDKKRLVVDHVTRWKISQPLVYFQAVATESGARARLDDIVFSEMRKELASVDFVDIISAEREDIMTRVATAAQNEATAFGISVIDVRIKRADLPQEVEISVYNRMQAERQRESSLFRSEGDSESLKIRSAADVTVAQTIAEASRQSRQIKGRAEAKAIDTLAEALQKDAEFYSFIRSLETYEASLKEQTTVVLSTDSPLFSFLTDPLGSDASKPEKE